MEGKSAKAKLSNLRQSPRKVRLVTDLIKGKNAKEALQVLMFTNKRAAEPISKLLKSAISNAKNNDIGSEKDLLVKNITVNEGAILYRRRPASRGRATTIRKRTSHISLDLIVNDKKDN